jgi:hypothetical protein
MTKPALHDVKAWRTRVPAWSAPLVLMTGIVLLASLASPALSVG